MNKPPNMPPLTFILIPIAVLMASNKLPIKLLSLNASLSLVPIKPQSIALIAAIICFAKPSATLPICAASIFSTAVLMAIPIFVPKSATILPLSKSSRKPNILLIPIARVSPACSHLISANAVLK